MSTIFSKIIAGDIPCYKIHEDADFIAFLDIMPLQKGHTLVVPKLAIDKAFDLPDALLEKWLVFAKPIAKAIEEVTGCKRCGMSVIGLEVPHAHMHLVPLNFGDDMNFHPNRVKASDEELIATCTRLVEALQQYL